MSEIQASALARDFKKMVDAKLYRNAERTVNDLLNEGYTPEEALMLAGIGGYEN